MEVWVLVGVVWTSDGLSVNPLRGKDRPDEPGVQTSQNHPRYTLLDQRRGQVLDTQTHTHTHHLSHSVPTEFIAYIYHPLSDYNPDRTEMSEPNEVESFFNIFEMTALSHINTALTMSWWCM